MQRAGRGGRRGRGRGLGSGVVYSEATADHEVVASCPARGRGMAAFSTQRLEKGLKAIIEAGMKSASIDIETLHSKPCDGAGTHCHPDMHVPVPVMATAPSRHGLDMSTDARDAGALESCGRLTERDTDGSPAGDFDLQIYLLEEVVNAERRLANMTGSPFTLPDDPGELVVAAINRAERGLDGLTASDERVNADINALRYLMFWMLGADRDTTEPFQSKWDRKRLTQRLKELERFQERRMLEGPLDAKKMVSTQDILDLRIRRGIRIGFAHWREDFKREISSDDWRDTVANGWGAAHNMRNESARNADFDFARNCASCGAKPKGDTSWKRCARCNLVHYCSRECQRKAWKTGHKNSCGEFMLTRMELPVTSHELLINAVYEYSYTPALTATILECVYNRTIVPDYNEALALAGAVQALVHAMRLHPSDHYVQEVACMALQNITAEAGAEGRQGLVTVSMVDPSPHPGRRAILESGAVAAVCASLSKHPRDANLLKAGLATMTHCLLGPDWTLFQEVIDHGGVERAIQRIASFPRGSCGVLGNICNLELLRLQDESVSRSLLCELRRLCVFEAVIKSHVTQTLAPEAFPFMCNCVLRLIMFFASMKQAQHIPSAALRKWLSMLPMSCKHMDTVKDAFVMLANLDRNLEPR